ncbi:MAG: ATP synthase F1 subunit epsilon [Planctomycetales bacterium]|nr:ATP synthase F1 subunit epsilon [Planctomycetales bacterium]
MSDTTTSAALRCIVVTPEETVLECEAEFVVLPLFDGEVGIAPLHSPMIGRLGFGELRIRSEDDTTRYYVDGGFVQVADNLVSVLTNRAIESSKIDGEAAHEQLQEALETRALGEEQMAARNRSQLQARAQLRIANRPR